MNFDADRFPYYIETAYKYREELKQAYEEACKAKGVTPKQFTQSEATWMPEGDLWTGPTESLEAEGEKSSPLEILILMKASTFKLSD